MCGVELERSRLAEVLSELVLFDLLTTKSENKID